MDRLFKNSRLVTQRGFSSLGKIMKNILLGAMLVITALPVLAGEDAHGKTISYVYQPDLAPTEFEFNANRTHGCGSSLYRVKSNDAATASRKFAIVLAAFTSGKKLAFHDTGVCAGSRSIVSWVRITN